MPALRNARHERFAQAVALGLPPQEAYQRAGYTPGARAAAAVVRLQGRAALKARIAELAARTTGVGTTRAGVHGVTASAAVALDKATSNASRSNGAIAEKAARNGAEKRAPNGSVPDRPLSDPTRADTPTPVEAAPGASVAALIGELEVARQLAIEVKQPAAAVSATMSKARIAGLLGEKGEASPGDRPVELTDTEAARRIALILALAMRGTADEAPH